MVYREVGMLRDGSPKSACGFVGWISWGQFNCDDGTLRQVDDGNCRL